MNIKSVIKLLLLVIFSLQLQSCGGGTAGPEFGEIIINITGLPDGIEADVELRFDVNGQSTSLDVTKTQTFSNLSPGTYTLYSRQFSKGLFEYSLTRGNTSFSQTLTLVAGESLTESVGYTIRDIAPGSINFTLDKSLFPAGGVIPSISLEGPEGFFQVLTEDTLIENLVAGDYRFFVLDFTSQNILYGMYFDYGFLKLPEGWNLQENAIIRPVSIRVKSVTRLVRQSLGVRDKQRNRFTIERTFESQTRNFLKKWDSQGREVWSTLVTSPKYSRDWSWKLAIDEDSNVYLGGFMAESNLFGGGGQSQNPQAEIHKYNAMGEVQWVQNLPGLFFNDKARIDQIASQNDRVIVFAFRDDNGLNPRVLMTSVMDFDTGEFIENNVDASFPDTFSSAQLVTVKDQGHWLRINGKLVHYSSDGTELDRFPFADGNIVVDPAGGFYTATTINGLNDKDVRFTRYFSDWSIDWRKIIENPGDEFAGKFAYDPVSQKLLYSFITKEYFPGFSKPVNSTWSDILTEWTNTGEQLWLRQLPKMPGPLLSVQKIEGTDDWIFDANTALGYSQYGHGNLIIVGP